MVSYKICTKYLLSHTSDFELHITSLLAPMQMFTQKNFDMFEAHLNISCLKVMIEAFEVDQQNLLSNVAIKCFMCTQKR